MIKCPYCGSGILVADKGDETFYPRLGCVDCGEWWSKPTLRPAKREPILAVYFQREGGQTMSDTKSTIDLVIDDMIAGIREQPSDPAWLVEAYKTALELACRLRRQIEEGRQ